MVRREISKSSGFMARVDDAGFTREFCFVRRKSFEDRLQYLTIPGDRGGQDVLTEQAVPGIEFYAVAVARQRHEFARHVLALPPSRAGFLGAAKICVKPDFDRRQLR